MLGRANGALALQIKLPNCLNLIAEEIEPKAEFTSCWCNVDNAATHCKFTRFGHGINAEIAVINQQFGHTLTANAFTCSQSFTRLADTEWRHDALNDCTNSG